MFDFDASKLLIIGVVALIVIGPKDLPRVLRQVGQMVTKLRRMAGEFQGQFMDAMKEADLDDLRNEVTKLKETASLDVSFNPVADIKNSIVKSVGSSSVPVNAPAASVANPFAQDAIDATLPAHPEPALVGASQAADPIYIEPAAPAHHTPAVSSGAVHAVEPDLGPGRPRRILVPKRRPPGDRSGGPILAGAGRGRSSLLPPRRDPRP
ncbi:MAG: Sec-independent protein translocase protein TatB [Janthinobacterium lividum]